MDLDLQIGDFQIARRVAELDQRIGDISATLAKVVESLPRKAGTLNWFFDARFPIRISNLYEPEYWDTRVKRWVGPDPRFTVDLPVQEGCEYIVEIQALDFINEDARLGFELRLNGLPCAWRSISKRLYIAEFVAPSTEIIRIDFSTPCAASPSDHNAASTDRRTLAFSFTHCAVRQRVSE